jgi:two-component system sensor histidine kinase YesM
MRFLKIKVYRNNFIIYITSLLVVCMVLGGFLCKIVINDQLQKNETAAMNSFNRIEASLNLSESKIDNYILNLYSNKPLLRDFICFFGNNAETYLTKRLDSSDGATQITSVLDDMQQFVYNNQFFVKQIAFRSSDYMNLMNFMENQGTSFQFSLSNASSKISENDIVYGCIYAKDLMNPHDITKPLGKIKFVMDSQKTISGTVDYGIGKIAVMSDHSSLYYPQLQDTRTQQELRKLYSRSDGRGKLQDGIFNTLYYSVYSSKAHGYKLISTVSTYDMMANNRSLFTIIVLGMFLLFLLMSLVIAAFMTRDAKYLNRMLGTISAAKSGNFKEFELGKRKDELRMIAQELNETYTQLNHYIDTEYKLKLKQKDTEMKMLQQQVNPHFLYNTLEIIRSCALVNGDTQVADAISNLGAMFRDVVKSEDVISIEKELEILTRYLKIMEFKFSGSFYYQIDVPPEIRSLKTVKFWMQPICENFFVHGYDKNCAFNLLIIRARVEPDAYVIEMNNNGKQIEPGDLKKMNEQLAAVSEDSHGKIGLINVCSRLRLFYGGGVAMTVSNNGVSGVTVSVRIEKENENVPSDNC